MRCAVEKDEESPAPTRLRKAVRPSADREATWPAVARPRRRRRRPQALPRSPTRASGSAGSRRRCGQGMQDHIRIAAPRARGPQREGRATKPRGRHVPECCCGPRSAARRTCPHTLRRRDRSAIRERRQKQSADPACAGSERLQDVPPGRHWPHSKRALLRVPVFRPEAVDFHHLPQESGSQMQFRRECRNCPLFHDRVQ